MHRGGSEPLIGATIDSFLRDVVAAFPDREAVVCIPQGVRVTYAELDARYVGQVVVRRKAG